MWRCDHRAAGRRPPSASARLSHGRDLLLDVRHRSRLPRPTAGRAGRDPGRARGRARVETPRVSPRGLARSTVAGLRLDHRERAPAVRCQTTLAAAATQQTYAGLEPRRDQAEVEGVAVRPGLRAGVPRPTAVGVRDRGQPGHGHGAPDGPQDVGLVGAVDAAATSERQDLSTPYAATAAGRRWCGRPGRSS